jgi:hypothetical protein
MPKNSAPVFFEIENGRLVCGLFSHLIYPSEPLNMPFCTLGVILRRLKSYAFKCKELCSLG